MAYASFGVINSCATLEENGKLLRKYHFLQTARPYLVLSGNSRDTVLMAVYAISEVIEENEAHLARLSQSKGKV